jgi:hypothetical protein
LGIWQQVRIPFPHLFRDMPHPCIDDYLLEFKGLETAIVLERNSSQEGLIAEMFTTDPNLQVKLATVSIFTPMCSPSF